VFQRQWQSSIHELPRHSFRCLAFLTGLLYNVCHGNIVNCTLAGEAGLLHVLASVLHVLQTPRNKATAATGESGGGIRETAEHHHNARPDAGATDAAAAAANDMNNANVLAPSPTCLISQCVSIIACTCKVLPSSLPSFLPSFLPTVLYHLPSFLYVPSFFSSIHFSLLYHLPSFFLLPPSFLPSFIPLPPSFLHSFLPSFLYHLHSFLPSFLYYLPSFLPSFLHSSTPFLPSFLHSSTAFLPLSPFLPSVRPSVLPSRKGPLLAKNRKRLRDVGGIRSLILLVSEYSPCALRDDAAAAPADNSHGHGVTTRRTLPVKVVGGAEHVVLGVSSSAPTVATTVPSAATTPASGKYSSQNILIDCIVCTGISLMTEYFVLACPY
jgi:hypothetical protein